MIFIFLELIFWLVFTFFLSFNGLFILLFIPLIGIFFILFSEKKYAHLYAILFSLVAFLYSLKLLFFFDKSYYGFQFVESKHIFFSGIPLLLGIDSLSLSLIIVTCMIMPLCLIWDCPLNLKLSQISTSFFHKSIPYSTNFRKYSFFSTVPKLQQIINNRLKVDQKEWVVCLLLVEFFLLLAFTTLDLFFFYVAFESILIPMFLIIGIWGGNIRKILANYYFFFYTFFFSMFFLFALLVIYDNERSSSLLILINSNFSDQQQYFLFCCFFFALASKVPVFPFHIWLPEAHVEAPTIGSVILASLLLKLGGYGFLRFPMVLFPTALNFFLPMVQLLSICGVIFGSLIAIKQVDLKKIIAYSSVAHMNFSMLGLYSLNIYGLQGAFLMMISHCFVSSGLFFLIGVLYDRYKTRLVYHYGGLVLKMPIFSIIFLVFLLANLGFPLSSSFPAELLIMLGLFISNFYVFFAASLGLLLSVVYCMWLYNRIVFGTIKVNTNYAYYDLHWIETLSLIFLLIFVVLLGIFPNFFFDFVQGPLYLILELY